MYGGNSSHFDTIMDGPCYKNPEQNYLQKQKSPNKICQQEDASRKLVCIDSDAAKKLFVPPPSPLSKKVVRPKF